MLEDLERIRRLEEEKARERKRLEEEMVRKREEERLREEQKRRQKQEEEDRRRADELRVREVEQQLISLAPASSQDALRIPKSRALYLVCVTGLFSFSLFLLSFTPSVPQSSNLFLLHFGMSYEGDIYLWIKLIVFLNRSESTTCNFCTGC